MAHLLILLMVTVVDGALISGCVKTLVKGEPAKNRAAIQRKPLMRSLSPHGNREKYIAR